MATKKTTGGKKSTSAGTAKKRSSKKSAAAQTEMRALPQTNRLWSILLFAIALLLIALTYIPGQAAWTALRSVGFGLFGWVLYLVAPALLYIAVLVAAAKPYKLKLTICSFVLLLMCGVALVFGKYQPESQKFTVMVGELYKLGAAGKGGGVFSVPLGLSLLCWTGRPAANIILIILLLVFVMLLTDITPAEIVEFIRRRADDAKATADEAIVRSQQRREEREAQREAAAQEREAAQLTAAPTEKEGRRPRVDPKLPAETLTKPRDRWNIDVNVTEDVSLRPAAEPPAATALPLETTKGQAFDPADHRELASALDHDLLAAAGRRALQPKKAAREDEPFVTDMDPTPVLTTAERRPLYDQDAEQPRDVITPAEMELEIGNTTIYTRDEPAEPAAPVEPETATDQTDGEIDSLIRRALDGRPAEDEGGLPDTPASAELLELFSEKNNPAPTAPVQSAEPELPPYHLPPAELLDRQPTTDQSNVDAELRRNAELLTNTLESFGVKTRMLDICRGPSVTRYELQPLAGVKISRITNLADDIALNLASAGVRIEAPIPGKPAVGIEVPNKTKTTVSLRSLIQSEEFDGSTSPLTMCLGRDIAGSIKLADLSKMPHLLIAGSTGSGKSVCINSIIMSFLYKSTPDDLRMILIDPKVVELAEYNGIPHLLMPVVTEPRKAAGALGCAVAEMERRYQLFAANNVRDIKSYNKVAEAKSELEHLPYIAIVIDELADLMMVAGKQVEDYICRIAQKARAAGMHLIVATQRPSVDVITGLIKANIPSRIAFAVSSQIDSRTILDGAGAEKLLGMGDMLFLPVGASKPVRIQGTFVKDSEIERVIDEIKSYADSRYDEQMIAETDRRASAADGGNKDTGGGSDDDDGAQDPMLRQAIETVVEAGIASTSLLQRKLKLGYARAARIMDEMEGLHVIGPYEGSKPRKVLIDRNQFLEMTMSGGVGED